MLDPSIASHQHDGGQDGICKPMSRVGGVEGQNPYSRMTSYGRTPARGAKIYQLVPRDRGDMYPNHVARSRSAYLK